ncbi:MAG: hypothetical protein ACJ74G_04560 [Blastocatellia bacterium]
MPETKISGEQRRQSEMLDERMVNWIIWKVIAPFGLLLLIYPIYKYIIHMPDSPFAKAFAHGDFLIFSALVLIEVAIEYKHVLGAEAQMATLPFKVFMEIVRVAAFFLIFLFGFMKYDVVTHELEPDHSKLLGYSFFSCSVAIFSVLFSLYVFWKITHLNTQKRLESAKHLE